MKLTKIIATIGPASWDADTLKLLAEEGMNIARFNFSHADHTKTKEVLDIIEHLNNQWYTIATMLDTKWPEMRTGVTENALQYDAWESFLITVKQELADEKNKVLFCDYPYLIEDIQMGEEIIIDSWNFVVTVIGKQKDSLLVEAHHDAVITSQRHINLPGVSLRLPAMTEKDKKDCLFGIEVWMDIVSASFIRTGEHVKEIRTFLEEHGGGHIPIISKIENQEWLENLENIVMESDAIMIARGDLGAEIAVEELPTYQKYIWEICRKYGKPVIYATELLKSMVYSPAPTRSEVSDVYNAVLTGHDLVMLSDESATGKYPVESLKMLARITQRAEQDVVRDHQDFDAWVVESYWIDKKYSARSAHFLAEEVWAQWIVLFTRSWYFAKLASAYQTNVPLYTFSAQKEVLPLLAMYYGVIPFLLEKSKSIELREQEALQLLWDQWYIAPWDKIVIAYDDERQWKRIAQVKIVTVWKTQNRM